MFGAKDSGKKRKNRQASRSVNRPEREPTLDHDKPGASAAGPEAPGYGLSIEDYASKYDMSEAEVWRMLRRGELVGRTQQGHLLVFGSPASAPAPEPLPVEAAPAVEPQLPPGPRPDATIDDLTFLPPLPGDDGRATLSRSGASAGEFLTLSGERAGSPELALLLDHLSLAKEENREILRLAQDSIKKVTEMSDAMLEMKDRVIDARETELLALKEQLTARDTEMKKLRQHNEDLEMLAHTMATASPKR